MRSTFYILFWASLSLNAAIANPITNLAKRDFSISIIVGDSRIEDTKTPSRGHNAAELKTDTPTLSPPPPTCESKKCFKDCRDKGYPMGVCSGATSSDCFCRGEARAPEEAKGERVMMVRTSFDVSSALPCGG